MKLKTALDNIEQLSSKSFNRGQKEIAKAILKKAENETEIEQFYKLLIQKVKLGFRFDETPIKPNGNISILKESKTIKGINLEQKNTIEHKLIIGENYDALKHLLLTHRGKIDIIYIDPPYNTESAKNEGNNHLTISQEEKIKKNTKEGKSSFIYRDKFSRTGWLNMMKERLELAKELLDESGVIFVSIDDNEQAYLKVLMDEIFNEENFICNFIWRKKNVEMNPNKIGVLSEYILLYKKNNSPKINLQKGVKTSVNYKYEDNNGKYYLEALNKKGMRFSENSIFEIKDLEGNSYFPQDGSLWRWNKEKVNNEFEKLVFKNGKVYTKIYDKGGVWPNNLLIEKFQGNKEAKWELESLLSGKEVKFSYPKPISLIKHFLSIIGDKNATILDFFAGSGTTGHAVLELNKEDNGSREFILVTNDENNIAEEITYERLHRIIKGEGTDGSNDFKWLEKNKPYEKNSLRVFELSNESIKLNSTLKDIDENLIDEYKKLNPYISVDELNEDNLYHKLSSLIQYDEVEDEIN